MAAYGNCCSHSSKQLSATHPIRTSCTPHTDSEQSAHFICQIFTHPEPVLVARKFTLPTHSDTPSAARNGSVVYNLSVPGTEARHLGRFCTKRLFRGSPRDKLFYTRRRHGRESHPLWSCVSSNLVISPKYPPLGPSCHTMTNHLLQIRKARLLSGI